MKQRITKVTCDKCGSVDADGTKTIGSGVPGVEELDLCPPCMKDVLVTLVSEMDDKVKGSFFSRFRAIKPTVRRRSPDGKEKDENETAC